MRDEFVNVSRWSDSTFDDGKTDLERDASQVSAAPSDTAVSHETSPAGSSAPITREPSAAARPTSPAGSFMNRLSNSFLGWTGWNIGDPTPGATSPQQRRLTISPRTSAIPEAVASSSGVSHSIAMEEPDPNFGGPRIRQRTAPGTELLDVPTGNRAAGQSHSRSESYPSRSATSGDGGMTPSQSGPARFRYPPLSTRTPSEAWSAANDTAAHQTIGGSSGARPPWDTSDDGEPLYVDYAPARRMAQQIAPVFLIFPLSYMLISTVGLARVIHTLSTSRPNPWFHTVSRWILLLQAPIDAMTLLYAARRLGKRLRAIVEEGNNTPVV
ncbi:hypothetical protein M407DRAFT_227668 [Tulasnella calospora MUT 4182]|uniref:Uncharacterized protein n=1 Tax=Tulasnella calospora MUT 4182 TaxID=1051891 RepID=A0A0C3L6M8_9AGAM|nr:hypothetical protein M407DRAFT_227668 [Tulasnella calospora MUT 4182]